MLDSRELLGGLLESFEVVITAERFSGERELWWSEAEPAEVEWEELVRLEVFLLAIPLDSDLSSLSSVFLSPGWRVLEPLEPGEEEEVMAVTSASARPSLTTLTVSTSLSSSDWLRFFLCLSTPGLATLL